MKRGFKGKVVKHTTHLSRLVAKMVEDHDHCVMISICDPGSEAPTFASKYHEVLSVHFHDISKAYPYLSGRWGAPDPYEQEMVVPGEEHAKAIAQFIRKHWDKHIIVHCEAGVSRSAAVCEVLVQLGWEYKQYVSFGRMHANPLLLSLLRNEFELNEWQQVDGGWRRVHGEIK